MLKKFFNLKSFIGTLTIFVSMLSLQLIGSQFDFFVIFDEIFMNYDLTDVYYTQIRADGDAPFSEDIVIVNSSNLYPDEKAIVIQDIAMQNPKVIGMTESFSYQKDGNPFFKWLEVMPAVKAPVVFPSMAKGFHEETLEWDSLKLPDEAFMQMPNVSHGVMNYVAKDAQGRYRNTWRFNQMRYPILSNDKKETKAFATQVAAAFNPEAVQALEKRNKVEEEIYYKGDYKKYTVIEAWDIYDRKIAPDVFKDKIVLFGYLGDEVGSKYWSGDKFYTPLNKKNVGRSAPDMYNVEVQANIISMILEGKYINRMPYYLTLVIAFCLCYINVALFSLINSSKTIGVWYDLITKIIQLVQVIFIVFLIVLLFEYFNYKANLTLAVFAILLSGDITEVYLGVLVNIFRRYYRQMQLKLGKTRTNS